MKILLTAMLAFVSAGILHALIPSRPSFISVEARQKASEHQYLFAFQCSPDFSLFNLDDSANIIPLLTGWGNYRMPVSATNDSARIYFEQGINMYYGFHIIESLASFDKAVKFDSSFAMGYWGKALAYGPNINDYGYSASPDALASVADAKEYNRNCTPVEQALIHAMAVRYSTDTTLSRTYLNQQYADEMKKVYEQFPGNPDVGALYADALMVQHPWDFYNKQGEPKSWTPPIVITLEKVLQAYPDHPGAAHYYIHAVEASNHPEKALAVAEHLSALMPGVAHVVHMPSHIFIRTGYYQQGEDVNDDAVKSYYSYLAAYPAVAENSPLYLVHNLHMQATCANMDGRFAQAEKLSTDCRNSFDTSWLGIPDFMGVYVQYIYMTPYLTLIRFGKWDDILHTPAIPENYVYASLLWHYGRGLAFARNHSFDSAQQQLGAIRDIMPDEQLKAPPPAYANPGIAGAGVAEKILEGVIEEEKNNLPSAITILSEAVSHEDSMTYNEPKDWVHPARQYLGNVLLKAGKYADAEKAFKEDLKINPNNGWSLTGLASALSKEGKKKEAAEVKQKAATAFAHSDMEITSAVF